MGGLAGEPQAQFRGRRRAAGAGFGLSDRYLEPTEASPRIGCGRAQLRAQRAAGDDSPRCNQ